MVIVEILWHIRAGKEADFVKAWREKFIVDDRSKLIGEFLCKPVTEVEEKFRSWDVNNYRKQPNDDLKTYVNVALWDSFAAFKAEIEKYIPKPGEAQPDFVVDRYRVVLEPVAWRIGDTPTPKHDSGRTF